MRTRKVITLKWLTSKKPGEDGPRACRKARNAFAEKFGKAAPLSAVIRACLRLSRCDYLLWLGRNAINNPVITEIGCCCYDCVSRGKERAKWLKFAAELEKT